MAFRNPITSLVGALIRTSAGARRVQLDSSRVNSVQFFSGDSRELASSPGLLSVDRARTDGGLPDDVERAGDIGLVRLAPPLLVVPPGVNPLLELRSSSVDGTKVSTARLNADSVQVNGREVVRGPSSGSVSALASTGGITATAYGAAGDAILTFVAPASGTLLVTLTAQVSNVGGGFGCMSFAWLQGVAISSIQLPAASATDDNALVSSAAGQMAMSKTVPLTGLVPGDVYSFQARYRSSAATNTATFLRRHLIVTPG